MQVRFCFFVWIFDIREKRYEQALRKTQKCLSQENTAIQSQLESREQELQKTLLTKLELTGEIELLREKLNKTLDLEQKSRKEAEKWRKEHGILAEEVKSFYALHQKVQSPRVLSMQEV